MNNSKLINVLTSFSAQEWKSFRLFVASPYFNNRSILIKMLDYLWRIHPEFREDKLKKEILFNHLFPYEKYDDKKLRYEISYLFKLLEKFLQINELEKDDSIQKQYLLKAYVNKKLSKQFQLYVKKVKKEIAELDTFHFSNYQYQHEIADLSDDNFINKNIRRYDRNIQDSADYLDLYYISKKLRYLCSMLDRQQVLNMPYLLRGMQSLETLLLDEFYSERADIKIFYDVFKILRKPKEDSLYENLVLELKNYQAQLTKSDLQVVYRLLINHSARMIRAGKEAYVENTLELYINGLDQGLFLQGGYLSPWTFKNIVSLGLRLNRYEWAEEFIQYNQEILNPKFQKDVVSFNLADLTFHQKNYEKTLYHLKQLNYTDIYFNLNGRVLLLKVYFHLEEEKALSSLLKSFTLYLRRNKTIAVNTRQSYLNFCSFLKRTIKKSKTRKTDLKEEISATKLLIDRKWLLGINE